MAVFEGAGVALVTPFKENGEVSYEKLEELVEEQIAGGTDCIVATGTTGESATMTEAEHLNVIRFICQVAGQNGSRRKDSRDSRNGFQLHEDSHRAFRRG